MNLTLDIGNSRIKAAIFDGDRLVEKTVLEDRQQGLPKNLYEKYRPSRAIIGRAGTLKKQIREELKQRTEQLIFLDHQTFLPFRVQYKTPETLGRDRIAAAAGALKKHPAGELLVIDAGTCITYDIIRNKNFLGGAISPGIEMRYKALNNFTADLPLLQKDMQLPGIGDTTTTSIKNGVQRGILHEVQGFVDHYRSLYKNLVIMITGGDGKFFATHLKNKIFAEPDLVSIGLNEILNYHVRNA